MRRFKIKILIMFIMFFCSFPLCVNADFNELRYEVTNVEIKGSQITFEGWAFIHKTNNFTEVISNDGTTIRSNGGQMIMIQAIDKNGNVIARKVVAGSNEINYNFYCELFYDDGSNNDTCDANHYTEKNYFKNSCGISKEDDGNSYCYYEDIYFSINFDTSNWNTNSNEDISFQIAVSNNDYESKVSSHLNAYNAFKYEGNIYTKPEPLSVYSASVTNTSNDYIKINEDTFNNRVEFIAGYGLLYSTVCGMGCDRFKYDKNNTATCTYGEMRSGYYDIYDLYLNSFGDYIKGRSKNPDSCDVNFLGGNCLGSYSYAINVDGSADEQDKNFNSSGKTCKYIATPCTNGNCKVALVAGSFVKIAGGTSFSIKINNKKKCDVTDPDKNSGTLKCNDSKSFNSKCDILTVNTTKGKAEVTIEQTGYISSILTPGTTYAGGGFNFGIMYYNTIKWDYAPGTSRPSYHNLVVEKMNDKLKDYNDYINNININELKFNNVLANLNMIKSCSTNKSNKDYYKDELITTCVFSFPLADIDLDGDVSYKSDSVYFNINNKYYTPLNFNGKYSISAKISGMDRITESAAITDSKEKGKKWTGSWEDTFTNCDINLYTLIAGIPKFIYRPIDINNPFPNRNAGINWYDWINIPKNKIRLEDTYSNSADYSAILDNKAITDIKNYNSNHNYLEWDSIDEVTKESSFITENNYRVRGGN